MKACQDDSYCQYARSAGAPVLVEQIARQYAPKVLPSTMKSRKIDPATEIVVTVGASQAISLACTALLQEGDEAILIEPAFDMYTAAVQMAGATPVYIPFRSRSNGAIATANDLCVDLEDLENAVTEKTRMFVLNTPHNPLGKVFSRDELIGIADVLDRKAPSCIVMSDEVYEHLVFEGEHVPFASVSENAFDRTLSIYSFGKTFSSTGTKIGWVVGPHNLIRDLQIAQQFVVFCTNHMGQAAAAEALELSQAPYDNFSTYFDWICDVYRKKRDFLVEVIRAAGLEPIVPQGAFYICARVPDGHPLKEKTGVPEKVQELVKEGKLQIDPGTVDRSDYNISRRLVVQKGVTTIPISAFVKPELVGESALSKDFIRFAFCHPDHVLKEASRRLR